MDIQDTDLRLDRDELEQKHRRECALLVRRLTSEDEERLLDEPNQMGLADLVAHVTD